MEMYVFNASMDTLWEVEVVQLSIHFAEDTTKQLEDVLYASLAMSCKMNYVSSRLWESTRIALGIQIVIACNARQDTLL